MRYLLILAVALTVGCAAIQTDSMTQRMATQYSVLKYIGEDPSKAGRIITHVDNAIRVVNSGEITFGGLIDRVNASIRWEGLDAADTLLLKTLMLELQNDLGGRVSVGVLTDEDKQKILAVLQWIKAAAELK